MIKPPYTIPTMQEIKALPWNGFTVASTFSGCGGSSLGYRMSGYRVAYANEFIAEARDCYRANCSPDTFVDGRDIRTVKGSDILDAIGKQVGELDLLDGSPPCASYSTAGARSKLWGKSKNYSGVQQRTDDLWPEYIRLVREIQPKTFIAENVSGMVKGVAKGVFIEVLRDLKAADYRVVAKVIDASWLGLPQARKRTIFIGVRNDIGLDPAFPRPFAGQYSLRDALDTANRNGNTIEADCDITRFAIGREWDRMGRPGTQSEKYFQLTRPTLDRPCPTMTATNGVTGAAGVCHPTARRKFSIAEAKAISGVPHDFILSGTYRQQIERLGRIHSPLAVKALAETIRDSILEKIK